MNERFVELRKALNLSQREFAERIGLQRQSIGAYENGLVSPSNTVITSICKEYNVNRDWLLSGTGEMFVPRSPDLIDELARQYHFSPSVTLFFRGLTELEPEVLDTVVDALARVASQFNKAAEPQPPPASGPTLEEMHAELEREYKLEKGETAGSSASSPAGSGVNSA